MISTEWPCMDSERTLEERLSFGPGSAGLMVTCGVVEQGGRYREYHTQLLRLAQARQHMRQQYTNLGP